MRRILATTFALVLTASAGHAADMPQPQPVPVPVPELPGWTGFYIGANAGGAFGNSRTSFNFAGFAPPTFDTQLRGVIGGGQIGYTWQTGPLVLGLEADFDGSSMSGNRPAPCIAPICGLLSATYSQKVPWFGTVRPRVGYAAGSWMVYATGGFAYGERDTNATAVVGGLAATQSQNETRNGFTIGGGAEFEFAPRWTAKLEYLYVDLGHSTTTFLVAPLLTSKARVDFSVVRAGVNYRFW